MSKIKNGGLDRYGAEPFEQRQFGIAGVEGVNILPVIDCAGMIDAHEIVVEACHAE